MRHTRKGPPSFEAAGRAASMPPQHCGADRETAGGRAGRSAVNLLCTIGYSSAGCPDVLLGRRAFDGGLMTLV